MAEKLDDAALAAALTGLDGWSRANGTIRRQFSFADFSEAFAFMTRVALLVQAANHHPDWSNSYNKVEIALSTHSAGGVTEKDVRLAGQIQKLSAYRT